MNEPSAPAASPIVPTEWGLLDAEAQHEAFPDTFPIPSTEERTALRAGDMVKLVFVLDPPPSSGPNAERMWVEVRAARPDGGYEGWLTNRPKVITSLEPSAVVAFDPKHVAGIALRTDEVTFDVKLRAVVSTRLREVPGPPGWVGHDTPLDASDIVLGHGIWMAVRAGIAAGAVAVALALFADTRSWGLVPSVPVAMLVGAAFAMPTMAYSVGAEMDGGFAALQRFVIIPLFLFGGAFYPLSQLPTVVQWLAKVAPLWHGVVVARAFTAGHVDALATVGHLAYVAAWGVAGSALATRRLRRRLYP